MGLNASFVEAPGQRPESWLSQCRRSILSATPHAMRCILTDKPSLLARAIKEKYNDKNHSESFRRLSDKTFQTPHSKIARSRSDGASDRSCRIPCCTCRA